MRGGADQSGNGRLERVGIFAIQLLIALGLFAPASRAAEIPEAAAKYFEVLHQRPAPGVVFDRFLEAWQAEHSLDDLEAFLRDRATRNEATSADGLLFGHFLANRGRDREAREAFATTASAHPETGEAWFWKAQLGAGLDDFEGALADLDKARKASLDPQRRIEASKLKGRWMIRLGRTDEALIAWRSLLDETDDLDLFEDVIDLQLDEGLFDAAGATAVALIEKSAGDPHRQAMARLRQAEIFEKSGNREEAVESIRKVLAASGAGSWMETETLIRMDRLFRKRDDLTELTALIASLVEDHPRKVALRRAHADLLAETGSVEKAVAVFQGIVAITPGDRRTRERFVEFLDRLGDRERAIIQLGQLIESHPEDAELRIRMAMLHHAAGQNEDAIGSVNRYLEISNRSEHEHLRAARLLERFEAGASAEAVYRRMIAAFPESAEGKEALAAFWYREERIGEALALWREVARSGDAAETLRIARVLSSRNEHAAAYELLRERAEEKQTDPVYLAQLCTESILLDRESETVGEARRLVALARDSAALGSALKIAGDVIESAGRTGALVAELRARERRTIQDTCLLSELLDRMEQLDEADEILRLAASEPENRALALEQRIRFLASRKVWVRAAAAAEEAYKLPGGQRTQNVRRLVDFAEKAGQPEVALEWLEEWKRLAPGSATSWMRESGILFGLGLEDEAFAVLEKAARKFDGEPAVREQLAMTYAAAGRGADAEREYLRLYEDTESESGKLRWASILAETAAKLGHMGKVIDLFEERRRKNPGSAGPLLALAEAHRRIDATDAVRRYLAEAIRIRPTDLSLRHQLATAESGMGDWQSARRTLERARELDRTEASTRKLARLLLDMGEDDEAFRLMLDLAAADTGDASGLEKLADSLAKSESWPQIITLIAPLAEKQPEDYRLRYLQGLALEENGEYEAAATEFLKVLEVDRELPEARRPVDNLEEKLHRLVMLTTGGQLHLEPEAAVPSGFLELNWQRYAYPLAYRHWYPNGSFLFSVTGASQRPGEIIRLPHSLQEARAFALTHLRRTGQVLGAGSVEKFQRAAAERGIVSAPALFASPVRPEDWGTISGFLGDGKFEDDPGALADWLIYHGKNQRESPGDLARLKKAFALFRDDYPELALNAALAALTVEGKDAAAAGSFFEIGVSETLPRIDKPSPLGTSNLAILFNGALSERKWQEAHPASFDLIRKKLATWFAEMDSRDPLRPKIFQFHAAALWNANRIEALANLINDEVAAFQSRPGNHEAPAIWQGVLSANSLPPVISPLDFPPPALPRCPLHVSSLFDPPTRTRLGDWNRSALPARLIADPGESRRAWFDRIEDRALRVVAASQHGEPGRAEALVDQILQDPGMPTPDEKLLAAVWLAAKGLTEEAHARFLEVRDDLPGAWPARIDRAILGLLTGNQFNSPKLIEAGRLAGSRLERAGLTRFEKSELAAFFTRQGLTEDAGRLLGSAATATGARPRPSQIQIALGGVALGGGVRSRLERYMRAETDRIEEAVQFSLTRLRRQTHDYYRQPSLQSIRDAKSFASLLQETGFLKDVAEAEKPAEDAPAEAWQDYAARMHLLDRRADAGRALQEAIKKTTDVEILGAMRAHLFALSIEKDPILAEDTLLEIDPESLTAFGNFIQQWSNFYWGTVPINRAHTAVIGAFTTFLEKREDLETVNAGQFDWLKSYLERNAGELRHREPIAGDRDPEFQERFANLCRAMLRIPALGELGFSGLAMLEERDRQSRKVIGYELGAEAREILAREVIQAPPLDRVPHRNVPYRNDALPPPLLIQPPGQYLIDAAFHRETSSDLEAIIRLSPKNADFLRSYANLLFCPEAKFGDAIEGHLAISPTELSSRVDFRQGISDDVLAAWRARRIETDIDVGDRLFSVAEQTAYWHLRRNWPRIVLYLEGLIDRGDRQGVRDFLDSLAEIEIGPAGNRVETVRAAVSPGHPLRGMSTGQEQAYRIRAFFQMIASMGHSPKLLAESIRFFRPYADSGVQHFLKPALDPYGKGEGIRDVKTAMELLEHGSFLVPVEAFDPLVFPTSSDTPHETLFGSLINYFRLWSPESRDEVVRLLEEKHPATFGRDLALALLATSELENRATEFFARHDSAIRALPESRRRSLGILIESTALHFNRTAGIPEGWSLIEILREQSKPASSLVAKIMAAKAFSEIGIDGPTLSKRMPEALLITIEHDPGLAAECIGKLWRLADDALKQGDRSLAYASASDLVRSFWRELFQSGTPSLGLAPFLMDVTAIEEVGREIAVDYYEYSDVSQAFDKRVEKLEAEVGGKIPAFKAAFRELGEVCGDRQVVLLGSFISRYYHDLKVAEYNNVRTFLKQAQESGDYPDLARAIEMGLLKHHATHEWGRNNQPGGRTFTEDQQWLTGLLRNDSLPLRWRSILACTAVWNEHELLIAPDVVYAAADVLMECFEDGQAIGDAEFGHIGLAIARVEQRDSWNGLAREVMDRWNRTTGIGVGALGNPGKSPYLTPDRDTVLAMLELALKLDDESAVERLLLNYGARLQDQTAAIFTLAREGRPDLAGSFVSQHWRQLSSSFLYTWHDGKPLPPGALEGLVDGAGSPGPAMLAEVVVASAPDVKVASKQPGRGKMLDPISPSRDDRLAALADRFRETEFESGELRRLTLEWIAGQSASAADLLLEEIENELKDDPIVPAAVMTHGTTKARRKMWLAYGHMSGAIRRGDLSPFERYHDSINRASDGNTRRWLHYETFKCLQHNLDDAWPNDPEGIARQLVPILEAYLESRDLYNKWDNALALPFLILSQAIIGKTDEFDRWWQRLPRSRRDEFIAEVKGYKKFGLAASTLLNRRKGSTLPLDRRLAVLDALYRTDIYREAYDTSPNWFRYLATNGILTPAEIVEHQSAQIEAFPRHGWAPMERIIMLARTGKLAEALAYADARQKWVEETKPPQAIAWQARLTLGKAEALLIAKNFEQALAALTGEFPENVPAGLLNNRRNLENRIRTAAEPAGKKP